MEDVSAFLRAEAREADLLHEQSRRKLVAAVRTGSRAGLSQREIAAAVGRSQPEVSRLLRFHGVTPTGRRLSAMRRQVIGVLARYGAHDPRVFGSVARGEDGPDSDVDILVAISPTTSLFDLARMEGEVAEIIGRPVDIVPDRSLPPGVATSVEHDAVPL